MDSDMLRADPRLRRQTALAVVFGAIVGAAIIFIVARHFQRPGDLASPAANVIALKRLVFYSTVGIAICLLALSIYLTRTGLRSLKQQQWPLAGTRVVRDTPVRRGDAARRIGHRALAAGFGLLLLAFALPICALFWLAALR